MGTFAATTASVSRQIRSKSLEPEADLYTLNDVIENTVPEKRTTTLQNKIIQYLDDPYSSLQSGRYSNFMRFLVFLSALAIYIQSIPEYNGLTSEDSANTLFRIDCVFIGIFTFELIVHFIAVVDKREYVMGYSFWVDMIAILPFYLNLIPMIKSYGPMSNTLEAFRMLRVLKIGKGIQQMNVIKRAIYLSAEAVLILGLGLFIVVVLSASLIYLVERGDWDTSKRFWVIESRTVYGDLVLDLSRFQTIADSMWWCLVTLSTAGYGDMIPVTSYGRVIASFSLFCGVLILSIPASVLGSNFLESWEVYYIQKTAEELRKTERKRLAQEQEMKLLEGRKKNLKENNNSKKKFLEQHLEQHKTKIFDENIEFEELKKKNEIEDAFVLISRDQEKQLNEINEINEIEKQQEGGEKEKEKEGKEQEEEEEEEEEEKKKQIQEFQKLEEEYKEINKKNNEKHNSQKKAKSIGGLIENFSPPKKHRESAQSEKPRKISFHINDINEFSSSSLMLKKDQSISKANSVTVAKWTMKALQKSNSQKTETEIQTTIFDPQALNSKISKDLFKIKGKIGEETISGEEVESQLEYFENRLMVIKQLLENELLKYD